MWIGRYSIPLSLKYFKLQKKKHQLNEFDREPGKQAKN